MDFDRLASGDSPSGENGYSSGNRPEPEVESGSRPVSASEEPLPVLVIQENVLPGIAPGGDVVERTRTFDAQRADHKAECGSLRGTKHGLPLIRAHAAALFASYCMAEIFRVVSWPMSS